MTNQPDHDFAGPADGRSGRAAGPEIWGAALPWEGLGVLVVEDDYMLAEDLREALERQGAQVIGPVASAEEALDLLGTGLVPDAAILDMQLSDGQAYPVADVLLGRGVPFVFATSSEPWMIPHTYADVPRAEKPVDIRRLEWTRRKQEAVAS